MSQQISVTRTPRILIIDDDDVLRRWLRAQLEQRGFEVWEESQGDEALAAYESKGPWDFVLSDFFFLRGESIKTGLDLVREIIRKNPTQRMAIHTSERGLQAPVPVLNKPYPIVRLLRLLRDPVKSLALKFRLD